MKKILVLLLAAIFVFNGISVFALEFIDIKEHWAEDSIYRIAERGIVHGKYITTKGGQQVLVFIPDGTVTRAEFVKIIVSTLTDELSVYQTDNPIYPDVTEKTWYSDYLQTATDMELINHEMLNNGNFEADTPITREIMAAIISNAIYYLTEVSFTYPEESLPFHDSASISAWAFHRIGRVYTESIMRGGADNNFEPQQNAIRAEAVAVLERFLDDYEGYIIKQDTSDEASESSETSDTKTENSSSIPNQSPD